MQQLVRKGRVSGGWLTGRNEAVDGPVPSEHAVGAREPNELGEREQRVQPGQHQLEERQGDPAQHDGQHLLQLHPARSVVLLS